MDNGLCHEHVAICLPRTPTRAGMRSGPFIGWGQYRKEFENENADEQ